MDLLVEALWSVRLPCTLALLIPGFVPTVGARSFAPWAVGSYIAAGSVVFWLNATAQWFAYPDGWVAIALGGVLAGMSAVLWKMENAAVASVAGAVFGAVSAWLWLPCVGSELGTLLNRATEENLVLLPRFAVYVFGVASPLVPLAAAPFAWPKLVRHRDARVTQHVVFALGLLLAVGVAFGYYEDVVGTLRRWSLQLL